VLKEKCLSPPIMHPEYMWVDEEVGTYFSCYNHELDLINVISWLLINDMTDLETCSITLCMVRSNATLLAEFVLMNRDFFYMYDCLFRDLHVKVPFDDFTMGVLWILNVAPTQLH